MALLLFHLRVGVRIAVRSFIPLFAALLWLIMLQMNPAGLVTMLALSTFAPQPSVRHLLPIAVLAFLLPLWAAPRLSLGLNGWIRHLGFSRRANKRGLLLSLAMAQVPLWISLVALGFVAHHNGSHVWRATPRLCLLLAAAVYSALPATRRFPVVLLAFSAAACVFSGSSFALAGGILLLIAADLASGDIRELPRPKSRHAVGSLFEFRISWRALGLRLPLCFVASLLIIGATALFARNNELSGSLLAGAARFGACMAVAVFLWLQAAKLAERRPAWSWARSFPISSYRRVTMDALFAGLHAVILLVPVAVIDFSSMWFVLLTLPLFSIRAAEYVRKIPARRTGTPYLLECFGAAALLALLPWTVLVWLAATVPAYISARNADTRQKVSRWLELHYLAAGDPLSWSDR